LSIGGFSGGNWGIKGFIFNSHSSHSMSQNGQYLPTRQRSEPWVLRFQPKIFGDSLCYWQQNFLWTKVSKINSNFENFEFLKRNF
jgi:hypothetical protein